MRKIQCQAVIHQKSLILCTFRGSAPDFSLTKQERPAHISNVPHDHVFFYGKQLQCLVRLLPFLVTFFLLVDLLFAAVSEASSAFGSGIL
ncbi:MAG: hypothetical protein ABW131_06100, partial [Candidatus Sedimenticola sp. 6PFRAG5]